MKKLIKFLPLIIGLLFLGYAVYVFFTASGMKMLDVPSSLGAFYAATYKYAALAGGLIIVCHIIALVIYLGRNKKKNT